MREGGRGYEEGKKKIARGPCWGMVKAMEGNT